MFRGEIGSFLKTANHIELLKSFPGVQNRIGRETPSKLYLGIGHPNWKTSKRVKAVPPQGSGLLGTCREFLSHELQNYESNILVET